VVEAQKRVERRLAAILATDVAGYGRLTQSDEEANTGAAQNAAAPAVPAQVRPASRRVVKTTPTAFS
jgi:hypothetical protein